MAKKTEKLTFPEVAQNLGYKAMSTGWPVVCIPPAMIVAMFWLVPDKEKVDFLKDLLEYRAVLWVSWLLTFGVVAGWFVHVRWSKSWYEKEITRITDERNKAQALLRDTPISTSKKQEIRKS